MLDQFLDLQDAIDDLFRPWRTPRYVDIHGDDFINALQNRISIKNASAGCTGSHRKYPAWFSHLEIHLFEYGAHFLGDRTGYDQQISLPWRKTHTLRAETGKVIIGGHGGHKFNAATRGSKWKRPYRIGSRKPYDLFKLGGEKSLAFISGRCFGNFYFCAHSIGRLVHSKKQIFRSIGFFLQVPKASHSHFNAPFLMM